MEMIDYIYGVILCVLEGKISAEDALDFIKGKPSTLDSESTQEQTSHIKKRKEA